MRDIWVTSDTHFSHANILTFKEDDGTPVRPFKTVEEMNETMVENWNKVVKPGDKVYHLGDVFFGERELFPPLWAKLRGHKRLIVGNHDDIRYLSSGRFFEKVVMWRKLSDFGLLLTHVPVHDSTLYEHRFEKKEMVNIHGHIHTRKSPSERHVCVCVEQTGYTPINIDELRIR